MDEELTENPAPWETDDLADPIEVYDTLELYDVASRSSVKQDKSFNKRIIRCVRRQRVLYDPAHPNFTNVTAKVEAWGKVAKQMRCDVDICKNAWVNLRFSYQKYVRRLRKFLANKSDKKRKRRPIMAFETEMVFLWRFIADKAHCRLPYDDKLAEKKGTAVEKPTEDDDIVLLEDDVEVIDLDDDATNSAILLTRQNKCQFQITPEIRRLVANIESYEELYDSDHRYYEDYRRKGIIWNAIANEVGDKATKLMKCWIQIQTRYEWEIMQRLNDGELSTTKPESELEHLLAFFRPYILKMGNTVYKSSYFLKQEWHEPIDHFKNIFSLLVAMKKFPSVIALTDVTSKAMASHNILNVDEKYTAVWEDVAIAKGNSVTAGQCETTWLILRSFYLELVNMRKQSYQLQDKWYFETIISELYALAKAQKTARSKMKQNIGSLMLSSILSSDETPTSPPLSVPLNKTSQPPKAIPNITQQPIGSLKPIDTLQTARASPMASSPFVPISVNLDEDTISSSKIDKIDTSNGQVKDISTDEDNGLVKSITIETNNGQIRNVTICPKQQKAAKSKPNTSSASSSSSSFSTTTTTTYPSSNLVVTLTKVPQKTQTSIVQQESKSIYPKSKSPQIRVKTQAQLQESQQPVKMFVQTRPQFQMRPQTITEAQLQMPQSPQIQVRIQTPLQPTATPVQTINLPRMQQSQSNQIQILPIPAQSKMPTTTNQTHFTTQPQLPIVPTNMGQLLPPVAIQPQYAQNRTQNLESIKTPKIVSAVSLAPRAAFAAPFANKGLQITAVTSGQTNGPSPPPMTQIMQPTVFPIRATAPAPTLSLPASTRTVLSPIAEPPPLLSRPASIINLPYALPDKTNISKCSSLNNNNTIPTVLPLSNVGTVATPPAMPQTTLSTNIAKPNLQTSIESKIPATVLARPHLTPASQLNSNEIMIELISSVNGNQLVVHGPPLNQKYSLPMSTTAMFIRAVLSIPFLHKKNVNNAAQVQLCWAYLAKRFNLPVHICKACWNFLSENFTHFPQIAPMEELTKPLKVAIKVWQETNNYFLTFNKKAAQLGLVPIKDSVEKFFDNIRNQTNNIPRISGVKLSFVADWQAAIQTEPDISNKIWYNTWTLFKNAFYRYMRDLEIGIDNKWSIEWWRVLAKLDFLLEEQYHNREPFYYIVRNKMIAECERCIKEEQKYLADTPKPQVYMSNKGTSHPMLQKIPDIDAYRVILAIRRYPQIYQKATEAEKNKAWESVALELQTSVTSCRFAFQYALRNYRLYVARDPANRCRLNQRYYKHLAEIYRIVKPAKKLNIKTPSELNQSISDSLDSNEPVFPERFVMDINMSNSSSNVVMKNWGYGLASTASAKRLEELFAKYRPTAVPCFDS